MAARDRVAAKEKLKEFFESHVGEIVTKEQLQKVAGISEWARRIRELRSEEGMQILSCKDRSDLKPGQYVLVSTQRLKPNPRKISMSQRSRILRRNGFTCQLCGATAGDPHPTEPGRKVKLQIDHIIPLSEGGSNENGNLRVICSACNEGRSNLERPPDEAVLNLLAAIRRAPRNQQLEVYRFLKRKFGDVE